jgi:hypothetical protein
MNDTSPVEPKTALDEKSKSIQRLGAGLSVEVNPTQWLGKQCQNAMFMHWIGARDAQEAAEKVRTICKVESRADIKNSTLAMDAFMSDIYMPYNIYSKKTEQDNHTVMDLHRTASRPHQRAT